VLVLICFCFISLHTPRHSASDFRSHRGVPCTYPYRILRSSYFSFLEILPLDKLSVLIKWMENSFCNRKESVSWRFVPKRARSWSASTPPPLNHVKTFKGWPYRDASSKLVQLWYKTFPQDQSGLIEMKNPTIFSNKTSTTWSCVEDQIMVNKISGTGFWIFVLNDQ